MKKFARTVFRSLYHWYYGRNGKRKVVNGYTFRLSPLVARGIPALIEEKPLEELCSLCKDANVVFDVGANVGIVSLLLSRHMKAGSRLYSFEPAATSFQALQENARFNKGAVEIIPFQYAVSSRSGTLTFTNDEFSTTNHVAAPGEANTVTVQAISMDDFCSDNNVVPDVIKIDVEGAEWFVLEGAAETLRKHAPVLLLELHWEVLNRSGVSPEMIRGYFDNLGYEILSPDKEQIDNGSLGNLSLVIAKKKKTA